MSARPCGAFVCKTRSSLLHVLCMVLFLPFLYAARMSQARSAGCACSVTAVQFASMLPQS